MTPPKKPHRRPLKYTNKDDQKAAWQKTKQEAYQHKKANQQQQQQAQQQPQQKKVTLIGF